MGTPGGEPKVLLNALSPMLGVSGDIKTPHEIMRIVGLMKDAEKMMSRCVYLNILKATCKEAMQKEDKKETLDKFLSAGGWGVLNKWLMEFSRTENFPVLLELMDVLRVLPITVDLLRQGNCGKLVKSMTKFENIEVKKNAQSLMKQWKNMIRGGPDKKPTNPDVSEGLPQLENSGGKRTNKDTDAKGPPEKRVKGEKGKIKLIDPLPKQFGETSAFMQALQQASAPVKKKRRNSGAKPTLPLDEILNKPGGEKRDADKLPSSPQEGSSPLHGAVDDGCYSPVESIDESQHLDANGQPIIDKRPNKKRKKKRSLVWASDDKICQIHYFELYEGEKSSHHSRNFSAAMQHELLLEKQYMSSKKHTIDHMVEKVRWFHPPVVDNHAIPNFHKGEKSREKFNQVEREKSVLAFIFLTKDSLPDSPVEPEYDPENHTNRTAPKTIPHDEDGTIFPVPKLSIATISHPPINEQDFITPPQASNNKQNTMSPAVQNIMSQLLKGNTAISPTSSESADKLLTSSASSMNAPFLTQSSNQRVQTSGQPSNNEPRAMQLTMNPGNRPFQQPTNPPIPPTQGSIPPSGASTPLLQQPQANNNIGMSQPQDWRSGPPEQDWRASTGDWRMNDDEWRAGRDDWRADPSVYYGGNGPPNGPPRGGGSYRGQRPRFDGPPHDGPDSRGGRRGRGYPYLQDRGGRFPDRGGWRGGSDRGRGGMRGSGPDRGRGGMDRGRGHGGPDRGRGGHDRGRHGGPHGRNPRDDSRGDENFGRRDVCRHYMSARGCRNGDKCSFIHADTRGPGR